MAGLFSPITVGTVQFANRLVMPPMVRFAGEMSREAAITHGKVTPAVIEHYLARVRAGTGAVIVEATAIDAGGRCWEHGFNLYEDSQIANLAQLATAIRSAGARAIIQLVHGGPQGAADLCGGELVGPSAVAADAKSPTPRELTVDEIGQIQDRFVAGARRAEAAGFDAVEIHGAHGYLLDSFLMRKRNHRSDGYGGQSRGRIVFETVRQVRDALGGKILVGCRISPFTKRDEPYTEADFAYLLQGLSDAGADLIHISTDGVFRTWFGGGETLGQIARKYTWLPLVLTGGIREPADAQRLIVQGHADFAGVGTAMLRDANWAAGAKAALGEN